MIDMNDIQSGDRVETNDYAARYEWHDAGNRGTVTEVDYRNVFIHVLFDNGETDVMSDEALDLIYRPINDPALYDRSLLDLIEWASITDHDRAMIYADMVEEKYNHLSGYGEQS